jgi:predicted transcriptional regulator
MAIENLFDHEDANQEACADGRAEADIRERRLVSHETVKAWLATWGGPARMPRPKFR